MDLWQLYIFVSVVDNKSFSKASSQINLSQPTVSSHIKELEEYFNCRLLDRLGKTTEPTKAGQLLYTYAKELLTLRDKAESAVHDFLGHIKGELLIGGSTIPSGFILPKLIGPFSGHYPDIGIHIVAGDTLQIIQKIKTGQIEMGIVGAADDDPHIRQERLVKDEMKLILPAGHPWAKKKSVNVSDLCTQPFIAREQGSGTWSTILNALENTGLDQSGLNTKITLGNTTSVIQAILNHAGISILSTLAVQDELKSKRLISLPVNGLDLNRYFYMTYSTRRTLSPICEKFIGFAKKSI